MKVIESAEQLQSWNEYRDYVKEQLKLLDGEGQIYVSKDKIPFDVEGKTWKGHAVLAGPKAILAVKKLKKEGMIFREGNVTRKSKDLHVSELIPKLLKESEKTFLKLRLGYKIHAVDGEEGAAGEEASSETQSEGAPGRAGQNLQPAWNKLKAEVSGRIKPLLDGAGPSKKTVMDLMRQATQQEKAGDFAAAIASFEQIKPLLDESLKNLGRQAEKIDKAVKVWNKTEQAATGELRKLQKAIKDLGSPNGNAVIRGLENILTRIDKVDDEAREASEAASRGDAQGFTKAREDFLKKMNGILDYVKKDELIRDADSNPAVQIKIGETLTKSLNALMKAV